MGAFPAFLPVLIAPTFLHNGGNLIRHFNEWVLGIERAIVFVWAGLFSLKSSIFDGVNRE